MSLQALLNLFAEEISLQSVTMSLVREKKSSLTRYCAQKVQKEYTTGSMGNGDTNPKLMQLTFLRITMICRSYK